MAFTRKKKLFAAAGIAVLLLGAGAWLTFSKAPAWTFCYHTNEQGGITIDAYNGIRMVVRMPEKIEDKPVTEIGEKAFENTVFVRYLTLPETLERIGDYAFWDSGIRRLTMPEHVEMIGEGACSSSGLQEVWIEAPLEVIPEHVFAYCMELETVHLPDTVTSIGEEAFTDCRSLASLNIPDSVTEIGDRCFYRCESLEMVSLPQCLRRIGAYALSGTPFEESLEEEEFVILEGGLLYRYQGNDMNVVIPDGVTSICGAAFAGCEMETVKIPDSVQYIGNYAFTHCENLTSVTIPAGAEVDSQYLFNDCISLREVHFSGIETLQTGVFDGCTALETVTGLSSVREVQKNAFLHCESLIKLELPALTSMMENAFAESGIQEIVLGDGLETLADGAFHECTRLNSVQLGSGLRSIGEKSFQGCTALKEISLPDGLGSIGKQAFSRSGLTSLVLPKSVVSLGDMAFDYCEKLRSVEIYAQVTEIPESCFSHCTRMQTLHLPEGLEIIGSNAFQYCQSLTWVDIPDGVREIGFNAFLYNAMPAVFLPDSLETLHWQAFLGELNRSVTLVYTNACKADDDISTAVFQKGMGYDVVASREEAYEKYALVQQNQP
ncbi:MAG: leucine-rich repeat domain-containing protein [Oscillospiraceae bacterium]|nr:leucine-rich repeat domain-containing protein [Oscillospiraceae bacterium]